MNGESITKQLKHIEIRLRPYLYADDINAIHEAIKTIDREKCIQDAMTEIKEVVNEEKEEDIKWASGLQYSLKIIKKHIGER